MHLPSSLLFCHDNNDDDRVDPHAIGSAEARRPPLGEGRAPKTPGDLRIKINTDRTSSPNYNNNINNHHRQVYTTATTNTNPESTPEQTAAIRKQAWSHQEILTSEVVVGLVSSSTATTSTTTSAVAKEHLVSRGLLNIKLSSSSAQHYLQSTPILLENLSIILRPRSLWSWSRSHHIEEALKRRERSFFLFLLNFCLIRSFFLM